MRVAWYSHYFPSSHLMPVGSFACQHCPHSRYFSQTKQIEVLVRAQMAGGMRAVAMPLLLTIALCWGAHHHGLTAAVRHVAALSHCQADTWWLHAPSLAGAQWLTMMMLSGTCQMHPERSAAH